MALFAVEVLGIGFLVLNPSSETPSGAVRQVSEWLTALGAPTFVASTTLWEFALNVALFVPLTFLASLLWSRVRLETWVIASFVLTLALETLQLVVLSTRSPELSDLASNTIGGFLGALLGSVVIRTTRRRRVHRKTRDDALVLRG